MISESPHIIKLQHARLKIKVESHQTFTEPQLNRIRKEKAEKAEQVFLTRDVFHKRSIKILARLLREFKKAQISERKSSKAQPNLTLTNLT